MISFYLCALLKNGNFFRISNQDVYYLLISMLKLLLLFISSQFSSSLMNQICVSNNKISTVYIIFGLMSDLSKAFKCSFQ